MSHVYVFLLFILLSLFQLITSRHQLLLSCHRSAALHQLYKRQIQQLEEEDHHPYLRFVPFNHSARLQTDKSLNSFVKNARDPKTASQSDRSEKQFYLTYTVHRT